MTSTSATIVAALVGAVVAAVTSILTTRYSLKRAPNYEAKIEAVTATLDERISEVSTSLAGRITDLNKSLEQLTNAHIEHFAQQTSFQKAEVERQNARRWRPDARIDAIQDLTSVSNSLVLKSHDEFTLLGASLQTKEGATVTTIPTGAGQKSTGFRVHVGHEQILKIKASCSLGALQNGATGLIAYRVSKGGEAYDLQVPFTTEDVVVNNTVFIKLLG